MSTPPKRRRWTRAKVRKWLYLRDLKSLGRINEKQEAELTSLEELANQIRMEEK